MRKFKCQMDPDADFVLAKMSTCNPKWIFLDFFRIREIGSIYLSKQDAAELGRYLIQLAEYPDAE